MEVRINLSKLINLENVGLQRLTTIGYVLVNNKMKDAVSYLLSNCYFTVGPKIFCMIIGIPMRSEPAQFFANLFLYYYESRWMNELKKKDLIKARKLCNIFRFIGDLNAINDAGEFEKHFQDIYPEELVLGKENSSILEASFLDLDIKINDRRFQVGLFDKRDGFPFTIVRMPYRSSRVPSNMFYSSIGAEILRIGRPNNNPGCFSLAIKPIVIIMLNQGLANIDLIMFYVTFSINIRILFNILQELHRNF